MKTIVAYLLREQSHSEPDVWYSLFSKESFESVRYILDVDGFFNSKVDPLKFGNKDATFTNTKDLIKFCDIHNIIIDDELSCFMED